MHKIARQFITLLCLAALVCGGQFNVCACELEPPKAACSSHDHSDHHESNHSDSDSHSDEGCDSQCPCATCHACHHAQVVLPGIELSIAPPDAVVAMRDAAVQASIRPADIFDPPKLS